MKFNLFSGITICTTDPYPSPLDPVDRLPGAKTPSHPRQHHRPSQRGSRKARFDDLDLLAGEVVEPVNHRINEPVGLPDPGEERRELLHRSRIFPLEGLSEGPAAGVTGELSLVTLEDR